MYEWQHFVDNQVQIKLCASVSRPLRTANDFVFSNTAYDMPVWLYFFAVSVMFCPFVLLLTFGHHHLHCRYTIIFLKEHAKEIYAEVRAAYIDTMNKVSVVFSKKSLATSMLAIILSLVHMHAYYCYLACSNKYV